MQSKAVTTNAALRALGTVLPAHKIQLMAQVSGQVTSVHKNLIPGGIVRQGDLLVQLDESDYLIALKQKQQTLDRAEADLQIEQGNQLVAKKEWEVINQLSTDIDPSSKNLALRKPQLIKAESAILAAQAEKEKAELDLSRTKISAPFDAIISTNNIQLGSQVSSQSNIATLVGIDVFWAELSLSMDKLPWIDLPTASTPGSKVTVYSSLKNPFTGRIVTLLPELENNGLMARLLIEIDDPMRIKPTNSASSSLPLPLGSHIEAEITGKTMPLVYKVPRAVVRDGNTVLTVSEESTLKTQPVSILWKSAEWAFINRGLTPESKIIISNVPAPIEGMALKIIETSDDAAQQDTPPIAN